MLLGEQAAEVVLLRLHVRLVVEDRRMAGMGDEIGEIVALWQVTGKGGRRIQRDNHGAGLQLVDDAYGDLADRGVRYGKDNHFRAIEGGIDR